MILQAVTAVQSLAVSGRAGLRVAGLFIALLSGPEAQRCGGVHSASERKDVRFGMCAESSLRASSMLLNHTRSARGRAGL